MEIEENTPKNNDPAANPQSQNQPNQSKSQKMHKIIKVIIQHFNKSKK